MNKPLDPNSDDLITISCPGCGKSSPIDQWFESPITGELPHGTYRCPKCTYSFIRELNPEHEDKPWEPAIRLTRVPSPL